MVAPTTAVYFIVLVQDLVSLPLQALFPQQRSTDRSSVASALALGVSSFVRHVSNGALTSIAAFSDGWSRNLRRLSPLHSDDLQAARFTRLGSALGPFVSSVWSGVSGLVSEPVRQLRSKGMSVDNLARGVGSGVLGAVIHPMAGALGLVAHASRGLSTASAASSALLEVVSSELSHLQDFLDSPPAHLQPSVLPAHTALFYPDGLTELATPSNDARALYLWISTEGRLCVWESLPHPPRMRLKSSHLHETVVNCNDNTSLVLVAPIESGNLEVFLRFAHPALCSAFVMQLRHAKESF